MASYTKIQELLKTHNIVDPKVVSDFLALAGTNGAAQRRPANIIFKNKEYNYCRNSGHYFLLENMVKDKEGKSKGYSAIGNSIYTVAQKHKKNLINQSDIVKDEIIALDAKSKDFTKDNKALRAKLAKLEKSINEGLFSDGLWMVETFLSALKADRQELFAKIAHTKESLA